MNDPARPPLNPRIDEQIRAELHSVDLQYWPLIKEFLVPKFIPPATPVPSQRPLEFVEKLQAYAAALFKAEANHYEQFRDDRNYPPWLANVEQRVIVRVLKAIENIETGHPDSLLGYHGVNRPAIIDGLGKVLLETRSSYIWRTTTPSKDETQKSTDARGTDQATGRQSKQETLAQQRRAVVDPILERKGWSPFQWATEAEVAYHTVADYLAGKTRPYPSTRKLLAESLGISIQQLPR